MWQTGTPVVAVVHNLFMHYLPLAMVLIYIAWRRHAIQIVFHSLHTLHGKFVTFLVLVYQIFGSVFWVLSYVLAISVHNRYGTQLTNAEFFVVGIAFSVCANAILYAVMVHHGKRREQHLYHIQNIEPCQNL